MSADDARARFAAATEAHLTAPLDDGIAIRHVDAAAWHAAADPIWAAASERTNVNPTRLIPPEQLARGADLDAVLGPPLAHRLLLVAGDEVIGAYWGVQEPSSRYYMVNTAMRPEWQGRGLYRRLLPRIVAAATDAGFAEIWSRHRADNNQVLVPKLRAGFTIAAFEVSPRWGLLVHLRRYLREVNARMHTYRVDGSGAASLRADGLPLP
ncbi:MAG TPA: GNAT family N-acetyltransferase [Kofleriaceae bacterium]|jgi:GNAT superfamily N-acetyltransferase|nr:GNAT family N-acetyltransferase [Kofleriaceae bacterium]